MAKDYFLKVDGIKGESTDEKHKEEIDIQSFSWGVNQEGSVVGAGLGSGKASFRPLILQATVNKTSPLLFQKCATGEHIKEATLVCRRAGGKQEEYLTIKLNDILVSSFQTTGNSPDPGGSAADRSANTLPVDQFALNYDKIEFQYKPQDVKGGLAGPVKASYDLKLQKKG